MTTHPPWFNTFLTHMTDYKKAFGHCLVPSHYISPDGYKLATQVHQVRSSKRGGKKRPCVLPAMITHLDAMGFIWEPRAEVSNILLAHLEDYALTHGHCSAPRSYISPDGYPLGERVRKLRKKGKSHIKSHITARLDALGFIWNPKTPSLVDPKWETVPDWVLKVLESIAPQEAEILRLTRKGGIQVEIAASLGISQPSVCYNLNRAWDRVQFIMATPLVDREDLRAYLSQALSADVDIMVLFWDLTSQSKVAQRLGVSQGLVRHRILRGIENLEAFVAKRPDDSWGRAYVEHFKRTCANTNILNPIDVSGRSRVPKALP